MGFVFYDLETTGISPAWDQPLQFAAIRTDDSFAEIERINRRCRIVPHIIPSPQALIATGVTPAQLVELGLPSLFDLAQTIMDLIERLAPSTWANWRAIVASSSAWPLVRPTEPGNCHRRRGASAYPGQRNDCAALTMAAVAGL